MLAITDHNTGAFIDGAMEACNQLEKEQGKRLTVLPGVEINVRPGVHLLAILGEGGSAEISDLLSSLRLPVKKHGKRAEQIRLPIEEVAQIVHVRNGLLIGAHCNSTSGVVHRLKGQSRLDWLQLLDALEIKSRQDQLKATTTIEYVTKELDVTIPFTYGSDSHNAACNNEGMWVKMAAPTITSLRQITFEPDLRVSRTKPHAQAHGRIVGFTTTHGIYANESFRFSPNLNVLLGGRGAGKSAALDLLRFAFEAEPKTDDEGFGTYSSRIMAFLQSVGEVLVVVVGADGNTYAITRFGAHGRPRTHGNPTFKDAAQVFQVVDKRLISRDLRPLEVLDIELFGQGEVSRLAARVEEQLRLIDENLDHTDSLVAIDEAEKELIRDEKQIIGYKEQIEKLQVRAASRPKLEERRDQLRESLADPIFVERQRWDVERSWVQGQLDWVKTVLDSLPESVPLPNDLDSTFGDSAANSLLEKVRDASLRIHESGAANLKRLRQSVEEASSELEGFQTEWSRAYENAHMSYLARLSELGAANLEQAADEHRSVEQDLRQIQTVIEPRIRQLDNEVNSLMVRRAKLLEQLRSARSTINRSRVDFVEDLNTRLDGTVTLSLSSQDTSFFYAAVDDPLKGSGIHSREEQVSQICDEFTPEEFVNTIKSLSIDKLVAVGITRNSAHRMLNALSEESLFKIERVDVPPLPCIRIRREGEDSYTDLSSLSVGEKCSAILSIALLNKRKPLIIDQPEDDLDHAFIIDSIVDGIRRVKSDRQIITATHNPNIPVLGDAEMVFRVARQAGNDICSILNSGGLEIPHVTKEVQGLEGGVEAF